jgi:formylglycine-generating enzyme required for sulfatase activity
MAYVPGGSFTMQKRPGSMTVRAFCMDVTEVTVTAYKACVRAKKCSPECLELGQCSAVPTQAEWSDPLESIRASRYCNGDRDDRQDHPVNCVSWEESETYCAAYDKRLPSPAEWEWAAGGATARRWYPWGNTEVTNQLCWSKPNVRDGTCAAGGVPTDKSPQGIVDLAGNVTEWVAGQVSAPGVPGSVRRAFGSSWYAMDDGYVRASLGGIETPSERNETIGFRCVKDTPEASTPGAKQ